MKSDTQSNRSIISRDFASSEKLQCPVCGRQFKKSLSLSLEAHVFHCLIKTEQSISEENHGRNFKKVKLGKVVDQVERVVVDQVERVVDHIEKKGLGLGGGLGLKSSCPFYKLIRPTTFSMDAFSFGRIEGCTAYFLSHFHSDHYMGLSRKFDHGPIYCSPVTGELIKSQLNVNPQFVNALSLNEVHTIQGVSVQLIDANHCPGAVIFVFEIPIPNRSKPLSFIHTGDFRADPFHWTHPVLLSRKWDRVYLDTTYCKEIYTFPQQKQVLDVIADLAERIHKGDSIPDIISPHNLIKQYFSIALNSIRKKPHKTLFVVGSYLIGKEKVFLSIASRIHTKVYTERRKMKIYEILADYDPNLAMFLTSNKNEALVHVVSMNHINHQYLLNLKKSLEGVDQVVAIKPTGWTFTSSKIPSITSQSFHVKMLKPVYLNDNITVIPLPYSEHSSYTELQTFCQNLEIQDILPTVNLNPKSLAEMKGIFCKWGNRK